MNLIKELYPGIHVTGAISNMSFGLPVRALLNKTAMAFAIQAGMDSAVLMPTFRILQVEFLHPDHVWDSFYRFPVRSDINICPESRCL